MAANGIVVWQYSYNVFNFEEHNHKQVSGVAFASQEALHGYYSLYGVAGIQTTDIMPCQHPYRILETISRQCSFIVWNHTGARPVSVVHRQLPYYLQISSLRRSSSHSWIQFSCSRMTSSRRTYTLNRLTRMRTCITLCAVFDIAGVPPTASLSVPAASAPHRLRSTACYQRNKDTRKFICQWH